MIELIIVGMRMSGSASGIPRIIKFIRRMADVFDLQSNLYNPGLKKFQIIWCWLTLVWAVSSHSVLGEPLD